MIHIESRPQSVRWGYVAGDETPPIATVQPGEAFSVDTVSHEGILPDQGRDPVTFFARYGVRPSDVLADAIDIAASDLEHDATRHGPHVITGPIQVAGARPGDTLIVETLGLVPRVPYGVVTNRHAKGALAGELPPAAAGEQPGPVGRFVDLRRHDGRVVAAVHTEDGVFGRPARAMLASYRPFLGLIAVAPPAGAVHSTPPGAHGGNLDVRLLGVGTRLHLPVFTPGALLQVGDPHFGQGDGEVALTAIEGSLRAVLRVELVRGVTTSVPLPMGETETEYLILGLDADLDEAVRKAVRATLAFVSGRTGVDPATVYAWMSAAIDVRISQVVDGVKGVHVVLPKALLEPVSLAELPGVHLDDWQ